MVTVRGKTGNAVPIIIPKHCSSAMEYLGNADVRTAANVNSSVDDEGRHYFFANQGKFVYSLLHYLGVCPGPIVFI